MKQQQLTALAMRKIYHAEQLGLDASLVQEMRDTARQFADKHDFLVEYIRREGQMLDPSERACILDKEGAGLSVAMFTFSASIAEWVRQRVAMPGGMRPTSA